MDAAHEAYARLIAEQRVISPYEKAEMEREDERERVAIKIKRRLPRVY